MIDEGIVEDPPECPVCMMEIEVDSLLEVVESDIIDIQEACIRFINNKAIQDDELKQLN